MIITYLKSKFVYITYSMSKNNITRIHEILCINIILLNGIKVKEVHTFIRKACPYYLFVGDKKQEERVN